MRWRKSSKESAKAVIARMEAAMLGLAAAKNELAAAERNRLAVEVIRQSYDRLSSAFSLALRTSTSAQRVRGSSMEAQIRTLVTGQQEHEFASDPSSGIPRIEFAEPASRAAFGPHISGMDYEPTPPGNLKKAAISRQVEP